MADMDNDIAFSMGVEEFLFGSHGYITTTQCFVERYGEECLESFCDGWWTAVSSNDPMSMLRPGG